MKRLLLILVIAVTMTALTGTKVHAAPAVQDPLDNIELPSVLQKSHYVSSVRITPFITHAGYSHLSPAVKGNWIGMTVSYAGLSRLLSSR